MSDAAYQAAQRAYGSVVERAAWPRGSGPNIFSAFARLLQDRAREFAVAGTMDGGKPGSRSRATSTCRWPPRIFFYHAGRADKLDYVAPGRRVAPLGVVGQVIPWNFPLLMLYSL